MDGHGRGRRVRSVCASAGRARKVRESVEKTRDELDRFYEPAVFGVAEEINNTHHGNLPGHVRLEEYETAPTYHSPYSDEDYIGQAEDLHLRI